MLCTTAHRLFHIFSKPHRRPCRQAALQLQLSPELPSYLHTKKGISDAMPDLLGYYQATNYEILVFALSGARGSPRFIDKENVHCWEKSYIMNMTPKMSAKNTILNGCTLDGVAKPEPSGHDIYRRRKRNRIATGTQGIWAWYACKALVHDA